MRTTCDEDRAVVSWDAPTAGEFGSLEMREDLDKNVRE